MSHLSVSLLDNLRSPASAPRAGTAHPAVSAGLPAGRTAAAGVPRPAATPRLPEPALPAARPPRPVVEGVLLAEVAEVLLLLLGHCAEQLAPAAAPAFAHS